MKLELPPHVASEQDLSQLLLHIQHYRQWLNQNAAKQQVGASTEEGSTIPDEAATLIEDWLNGQQLTTKTIDQLITTLEDFKVTASKITITLAAPPGPQIKTHLTDWCRSNLDRNVLVNFSFDRTILGGMVVRWGSHIYDWSFRKQILNNRQRFVDILRYV